MGAVIGTQEDSPSLWPETSGKQEVYQAVSVTGNFFKICNCQDILTESTHTPTCVHPHAHTQSHLNAR